MTLAEIIRVNEDACVNCHRCIAVCSVKDCNDGHGDIISLNNTLCIGCGECVHACTHGAREIVDDLKRFLTLREEGAPFVAMVAPSIHAHIPREAERLNGWLVAQGAKAVFDVSFGADLTARSYAAYALRSQTNILISSTCPVVVSYIECYEKTLLPYLAPVMSPMRHTAKMIRTFYDEYATLPIVVISPCIAKRREFHDDAVGCLNVTFATLFSYFDETGVSLADFPSHPYAEPRPEAGAGLPRSGGLRDALARYAPALAANARIIEGPYRVCDYLAKLRDACDKGVYEGEPLFVDCLNCRLGCNGGSGTTAHETFIETLERPIRERVRGFSEYYAERAETSIEDEEHPFWREELYQRGFVDRSAANTVKTPTCDEEEDIYRSMLKTREEDIKNCGACGYNACKRMAKAIFNGLNKKDNCHFYMHAVIEGFNKNLCDMVNERTEDLFQTNRVLEERNAERVRDRAEEREVLLTFLRKAFLRSSALPPIDAPHGIRYDTIRLDDGRFVLGFVDVVSREGAMPALSHAGLLFMLSTFQEERDVVKTSEAVACVFYEFLQEKGLYLSLCLCVFDVRASTVTYATFGHGTICYLSEGGAWFLSTASSIDSATFRADTCACNEGDAFLFFSDSLFSDEVPDQAEREGRLRELAEREQTPRAFHTRLTEMTRHENEATLYGDAFFAFVVYEGGEVVLF